MQWQPDVVEAVPDAPSADTERLLEEAGYGFKVSPPWGQVTAIATSARATLDGAGGSLAIPFLARLPRPYPLAGASDDRNPVGSAAGY